MTSPNTPPAGAHAPTPEPSTSGLASERTPAPASRLEKAAAAYCAQRELVMDLTRRIRALGPCEQESVGDGVSPRSPACLPIVAELSGRPWWEHSDDQLTGDCCARCVDAIPLYRQRYSARRSLGGLMRSMRAAWRALQ